MALNSISARAREFACAHGLPAGSARKLAGDASSRRYFRFDDPDAGDTSVVMEDICSPRSSLAAFVRVARHLSSLGLSAPRIFAVDHAAGLILMEDFGNMRVDLLCAAEPSREREAYVEAASMLARLHAAPAPDWLRTWGPGEMADALDVLFDYALPAVGDAHRHDIIAAIRENLATCAADAPKVTALRDFHSGNLMWLGERQGVARIGLLDFQDAFAGHPAYDLVSLIEDARRDVPPAIKEQVLATWCARSGMARGAIEHACAIYGLQRHLRIVGVFLRLAAQGKRGYLAFLPRVLKQVGQALRHPANRRVARVFGTAADDLIMLQQRIDADARSSGAVRASGQGE